jgi:cell division protein FtsL
VSLPARRLEPSVSPGPVRRRTRRAAPARSTSHPSPRPRRRRRRSLGFLVLSFAVLGSMVFGIVVVNVLLAQTSFRIGTAEQRLEELSQEHLELVGEQASLSAPGRIAAWASRHGMRLPDDIRFLHASGGRHADPAGAGTSTSDASPSDPETDRSSP